MAATISEIMDGMGSRILATEGDNESLKLAAYIHKLSDDISISEVLEAGEEFAGMMEVMQDIDAIGSREALESAFIHGFIVAMEWAKTNSPCCA